MTSTLTSFKKLVLFFLLYNPGVSIKIILFSLWYFTTSIAKFVVWTLLETIDIFFLKIVFSNVDLPALKNKNINNLLDGIVARLPEGDFENSINFETNISKDVFFSELTREAVFKYLNQELPYQIYVKTYKFEKENRNYKIYQNIYVKNDNHKKIVLGKNGSVIKKIGISARKEIEKLFKHKVSLFLDVQTTKQWLGVMKATY